MDDIFIFNDYYYYYYYYFIIQGCEWGVEKTPQYTRPSLYCSHNLIVD